MSDRCAECFAELAPGQLGSRYVCHPNAGYWSEVAPEYPQKDKAVLESKHGRPMLHYYGRG